MYQHSPMIQTAFNGRPIPTSLSAFLEGLRVAFTSKHEALQTIWSAFDPNDLRLPNSSFPLPSRVAYLSAHVSCCRAFDFEDPLTIQLCVLALLRYNQRVTASGTQSSRVSLPRQFQYIEDSQPNHGTSIRGIYKQWFTDVEDQINKIKSTTNVMAIRGEVIAALREHDEAP
jgi:hypothetical protein